MLDTIINIFQSVKERDERKTLSIVNDLKVSEWDKLIDALENTVDFAKDMRESQKRIEEIMNKWNKYRAFEIKS